MKYRNDIQGIRGVGVLAVLLGHMGVTAFSGAYVMVDAFYVISGFVITGTLLAEHSMRVEAGKGAGFSLAGFYLRRLKRIFPVAALVIVASVWLANTFWNPIRASVVNRDAWWAFFSGANINEIRKATDYFAHFEAQSPLAHYWSLAVEEQFYFVWPLLALLVLKVGKKAGSMWRKRMLLLLSAVWVASLAYSIWYTQANINAAYFSTFTRAWELASGALLAVLSQTQRFQQWIDHPFRARLLWAAGFSAVTYAALTFDSDTWFPGHMALIPVLGSVAVIAAGVNPWMSEIKVFNNPVLIFCGRISFSLYLWHWPVILFVPAIWPALSDGLGVISQAGKFAAVAIAFTLAVLSYILVERPVIKWQIGVPYQFRRPPQPGRLRPLLRDSSISLVTVWTVVVMTFVLLDVRGWAFLNPDGAKPKPADIDHPELVVRTQTQEGTATLKWRAELEASIKTLKDTATPAQVASLQAASFTPDRSGWVCDPSSLQCSYGNPNATTRVMVIGDSHTYMWADAFRAIVDRNPEVAVNLSVTGQCPNVYDLSELKQYPSVQRQIMIASCDRYHELARANVATLKPNVIVFSDSTEGYLNSMASSAYVRGYVKFVEWAKQAAPHVVILGSTPVWAQPATCLGRDYSRVLTCVTSVNSVQRSTRFQKDVARLSKVTYIQTWNWFCVRALCPLFIDDDAVTPDGSHINQVMGVRLADVLWENLRQRI